MLVCNNITYQYSHSNENALDGFTFNSKDMHFDEEGGKVYGLLGKNGAGKSTLIRILSGGIIHYKGECRIGDFSSSSRDPKMLQDIIIVPEEYYLPPILPLEYAKLFGIFYPHFTIDLLNSLIEGFEIPRKKLLVNMSFGQKKKFMIAFAFATRAKIIIFDEPTNGLDIPSKILFNQCVHKHKKLYQMIIVSTHQVKDVESIIDALILIHEGKSLLNTSIENIAQYFQVVQSEKRLSSKDVIFCIESIGGYTSLQVRKKALKKNTLQNVDIELFFTATLHSPSKIQNILSSVEKL